MPLPLPLSVIWPLSKTWNSLFPPPVRYFSFGFPSTQTKRSFNLLVTGLESALDACPAMPGAALEASIESCFRRPSLDPSSSLRATRMFVRGLLSLVSTSQRSLCQSVVPVLVRFVSERECEASGEWCTSLSRRALARQPPCQPHCGVWAILLIGYPITGDRSK